MAEILGLNAGKVANAQGVKINKGEVSGRVRCLYDEKLMTAEASDLDTLRVGAKLPAGARVVGGVVKSPDLGGSGTLRLGYEANGVDTLSSDAFGVSMDSSGQALHFNLNGLAVGKKFEKETQVFLTFNGATASATNKTIQVWLFYVVD
jgi:hypothetical protein